MKSRSSFSSLPISAARGFNLLILATLLVGLAFLIFGRFINARESQDNPYAYEIAAAFLGSLLTITITALLLQHQTGQELGKERSVKSYEKKLEIYQSLLKRIEEILGDEKLETREFFQVQMVFQEVVFIAGANVLGELPAFARVFSAMPKNVELSEEHKLLLLHAFGRLAAEIRADLNTPFGTREEDVDAEDILSQVEESFRQEILSKDERLEKFLKQAKNDRAVYQTILEAVSDEKEIRQCHLSFEAVGFVLRNARGKIILHVHPQCEMPNKIFKRHLSPKQCAAVAKILHRPGAPNWSFRTREVGEDGFRQIIAALEDEEPNIKASKLQAPKSSKP